MGLTDENGTGLGRIGSITRGGHIHLESFPKPKNRAGRDLPTAIGVGAALGLTVVGAVLAGPLAWYVLVSVAVGAGMWEVITRLREASYVLPRTLLLVFGQAIVWLSWPLETQGIIVGLTIAALTLMFGRMFNHGRHQSPVNYLRDTAIGLFVLVWIPVFGAFAAMLSRSSTLDEPGANVILTFMLCVVASDTGGFVVGVMFGSRPMAPAISPSKSWEGVAGSMVAGIIAGALTMEFLMDMDWWRGIILGIALVVCATMGDLVESQFKRELGIKDMSSILPAHGGIMDRLDGMLPSAAASWVVLSIITALD
ncbi:phosphatidate cytidylyltransferase [Corynebacterium uterequi]|uniref:Phosphatidate cytidylyltransferase n=1 Tax=Corynebacterium uterequi TaxID=1072256 RepID=A0A0G3HF41_9CORY|nr:phosphatidate cytidylyltransferase [Corynebacterium uterequi]AKK11350.1 CDP-diglyceride synthetase [Corynebacterium uterequi]